MSRVARLQATAGALSRAVRLSCGAAQGEAGCHSSVPAQLQSQLQTGSFAQYLRSLHTTSSAFQAADVIAEDALGKATGLERMELEAKAKGIEDPYHEDWLDAPFGTEDKPVQVTSIFSERVVGVPDPYDDSIIWWGKVEENQPPRQIIEGGEFFVLKRIPDDDAHGH